MRERRGRRLCLVFYYGRLIDGRRGGGSSFLLHNKKGCRRRLIFACDLGGRRGHPLIHPSSDRATPIALQSVAGGLALASVDTSTSTFLLLLTYAVFIGTVYSTWSVLVVLRSA